jgi:hypothetical protein
VQAANILLKEVLDAVTCSAGVVTNFVINVDQSGTRTEFPAIALDRELKVYCFWDNLNAKF